MLTSMTGFGRGEASNAEVTVSVELKSVNNRFRDIQLRVPREYMPLEARINRALKEPFSRGRIDAFVRRSSNRGTTRVLADVALALEYGRVINEIANEMVGHVTREVPFTFILSQPGVLQVTEAEVDVMTEWSVVETALQAAIEDLSAMRKQEGRSLHEDLSGNLEDVRTAVGQVEAVSVGINERLQERMESRIKRMVTERFDAYRITQEVAILADKADVSEELTRLRSHCDQFAAAMAEDGAVGRRLDFLLQEMNREVNTIGSKAVDLPIHRKVVDMKTILERMREQSANVE